LIQLGTLLKNADNLQEAVRLSLKVAGAGADVDLGMLPELRETIRRWRIKLDICTMLWQRHLLATSRPSQGDTLRFLNWDSSPQGGYNYLIIVEDVFMRPLGRVGDNPVENLTWVRRTMPITVIGQGKASVAGKLSKAVHSAKLESGQYFNEWRREVRGVVSDAGVEVHLSRSPLVIGGADISFVEDFRQSIYLTPSFSPSLG